ncbi:MAG: ScyD/ScyE family protein [Phaeodactylibacter sp.]|nr:ScyD/ScyE family protein [Phaeodactylibacter sp.]
MKKLIYLLLSFLCTFNLGFGQEVVPVAFDLVTPIDVNLDAEGTPWVIESGSGMNDGRLSKIHTDGTAEVIVQGLPSHFNFMSEELEGPLSAQVFADGTILVCQGGGPDTLSASILEFHVDDYVAKGAPLTVEDRRNAILHGEWMLAEGFEETNSYSFLVDSDGSYVIVDAAANALVRYTPTTESFEVIAEFPALSNPTPVGPPFIDAVPTKVLAHPDGGYLVSTLTGFPFLDGMASVYHVQADGSMEPYATGLTLVTDMAFDPNDGKLITLQFAAFGQVDTTFTFLFNSAQLVKVDADNGLDTLLTTFGPSPGLALAEDGTAYMTHLFLGQLLKTTLTTGIHSPTTPAVQAARVFPNPTTGPCTVELELDQPAQLRYQVLNSLGQVVEEKSIGFRAAGRQLLDLELSVGALTSGLYQVLVHTGNQSYRVALLLH